MTANSGQEISLGIPCRLETACACFSHFLGKVSIFPEAKVPDLRKWSASSEPDSPGRHGQGGLDPGSRQ
jgi:hypothetical protein